MRTEIRAYRVRDVAEICHVDPKTVYRWIWAGHLKASKPTGGTLLITAEELDRFLNGGNK